MNNRPPWFHPTTRWGRLKFFLHTRRCHRRHFNPFFYPDYLVDRQGHWKG